MPRKDPVANRAARDFMTHLVPEFGETVDAAIGPLYDLTQKCREGYAPTINDVLGVIDKLHQGLVAAEDAKWELLAATRPAGATIDAIARAAHLHHTNVKPRLDAYPISRARGENFVRVDPHRAHTGGGDSENSNFENFQNSNFSNSVSWELWFPNDSDMDTA
ncbi:Uncharacterised protein (plasmid) [Tsukamurella tyrosinosolvens]|uniref:hypothetical protein n=1 Tax=Tsukamurella tyrosinosolvens TaxID=57704 RepID=UPI000ABD0288|nr:hypothetical protein [Tsukamurella tyrosinosolvens]VEH95873.1 Uncharacterised protein [Tsukamurella tyrosinosolvens]